MFHFLVVFLFCYSLCTDVIDRPVIGVLSQPTKCSTSLLSNDDHYSYISANYVKWVESNGANVVPFLYDWDESKMKSVFDGINGLVLPGGGCPLTYGSDFLSPQKKILEWALADGKFPIWGTCQGFESLFILVAETDEVLHRSFKSRGINLPLDFNDEYHSRMFDNVSDQLMDAFKNLNVTFNSHDWGIMPKTLNNTPSLSNFFNIITTNVDLDNEPFISTMEAKNYPIYGTQWHPEIVIFSDLASSVHSYDSVIANQITSTFFVEECRKSTHEFANIASEIEYAIENYCPVFTGKDGISSRQTYFFPKQQGYHPPNKNEDGEKEEKKKFEIVLYTLIGVSAVLVCCVVYYCMGISSCICFQIMNCIFGSRKKVGKGERDQLIIAGSHLEEMTPVGGNGGDDDDDVGSFLFESKNRSGVGGLNQDSIVNSLFQ